MKKGLREGDGQGEMVREGRWRKARGVQMVVVQVRVERDGRVEFFETSRTVCSSVGVQVSLSR